MGEALGYEKKLILFIAVLVFLLKQAAFSQTPVNADDQFIQYSNNLLLSQFGKEWAAHYSPFQIKKNHIAYPQYMPTPGTGENYDVMVSYGFSGPASLEKLSYDRQINATTRSVGVGPTFTYLYKPAGSEGHRNFSLWYGINFVASYDVSKLISAQEAMKIAEAKGYDVVFTSLVLIRTSKKSGSLSLLAPGYQTKAGNKMIVVNAQDSTCSVYEVPHPVGPVHLRRVGK